MDRTLLQVTAGSFWETGHCLVHFGGCNAWLQLGPRRQMSLGQHLSCVQLDMVFCLDLLMSSFTTDMPSNHVCFPHSGKQVRIPPLTSQISMKTNHCRCMTLLGIITVSRINTSYLGEHMSIHEFYISKHLIGLAYIYLPAPDDFRSPPITTCHFLVSKSHHERRLVE